ncbi:RluA family pseudouridine synthase [Chengkuizengella sediminis]|uniref:RluA family pseudouridine synthase n=1 Tax=Chengkuizengella sediminis TaxID=1885917 RepID=UPI00138A3172|nr:RluA family pseudouridine synthase [Chengkuizengella sediminis]NDI35811.1 RluA family pseudouridine synthase [Chengkuizengella sediminis]
MNYYKPISYIVQPEENGWILKSVLREKLNISRRLLSNIKLTEKGVMVNGKREFINIKVFSGDLIEIHMEQETSQYIEPQDIPLNILYEDEFLLIVNKQAGIVVHPTRGHYANTLANGVVYHWIQKGENYRFRPIHRLDEETSGVLAIAKNPYVHQQISEQMINNQVKKEYTAIVSGHLPDLEGTVNAPIDRDPEQQHLRIVTDEGYSAITHYKVEEEYQSASLVRLWLETGRTHQIRVHMKHLGCPLVGDKMYGEENNGPKMDRQALHAAKLAFYHPNTRKYVEFTASLPEDMKSVIRHLKL